MPTSPQHQTSEEGNYTFSAILMEGFIVEKTVPTENGSIVKKTLIHRIREKDTITTYGYNSEHARCKAAKIMAARYPWLSQDYSLLYLDGVTVARFLLGQRRFVQRQGEILLAGK